jgi:hypothetical protein
MTQSELLQMLDHNTRKFLNIDVQEFLRRREQKKPIDSPAWGPIDLMASLLGSD